MNQLFSGMLKAILIITLISCGNSANAANAKSSNTKVTLMEAWQANTVFIETSENEKTNPANCSFPSQYVLESTASDWTKNMLLSAYSADRKVTLTIYGDGCFGNRPIIVAVRLQEL